MTGQPQPGKTGLGMEQNLEGALCYILGWITGIVFVVVEKDNRFVRFHAWQSIATFLPLSMASFILGSVPFFGWILGYLVWAATVILWLVLMIQAYQGKEYDLPIAGKFARSQLH